MRAENEFEDVVQYDNVLDHYVSFEHFLFAGELMR